MKQTIISMAASGSCNNASSSHNGSRTGIHYTGGSSIRTIKAHMYEPTPDHPDSIDEAVIDASDFPLYKRRPELIFKTLFIDLLEVDELSNSASTEFTAFIVDLERVYGKYFIMVLPITMVNVYNFDQRLSVRKLRKEILDWLLANGFENRHFMQDPEIAISDYYDIIAEAREMEDDPDDYPDMSPTGEGTEEDDTVRYVGIPNDDMIE